MLKSIYLIVVGSLWSVLSLNVMAATVVQEIKWEALVPKDWNPDQQINDLMDRYQIDQLSDEDPRVAELQAKMDAVVANAPVVQELNGQTVRLSGFVVPLGAEGGEIRSFLLVPYYGACIHVPPPPSNQTVEVVLQQGGYSGRAFDTVTVTGVLKVEHSTRNLAEAGYRIEASRVEPYKNRP